MNGLKFSGFGHSIPVNRVDNNIISANLETDDNWIQSRTGIKARHFVDEKTYCCDLAKEACEKAIKNAGIDASEIAYLIVCSFSAEFPVPSIACMVQEMLNIPDSCTCFDINSACAGFLYGLHTMRGLLIQKKMDDNDSRERYGVVVGSEVISRHMDMTDRGTCILFGDGAGAAVVSLDENKDYRFTSGSRGNYEVLHVGGRDDENSYVGMNGQDVFKFAVSTVPKCINEVLDKSQLSIEDIDLVIMHQANKRIIEAVRTKFHGKEEQFPVNIDEFGNTSAASIPILMSELSEKKILTNNQRIILAGFGAGLTWGATLLET